MKNAKMLLAAIAVVTVAGGALAFKAQNRQINRYCTTSSGTTCSVDNLTLKAATPGNVSYATTTGDDCVGITCTSTGTLNTAD